MVNVINLINNFRNLISIEMKRIVCGKSKYDRYFTGKWAIFKKASIFWKKIIVNNIINNKKKISKLRDVKHGLGIRIFMSSHY